MSTVVCQQGVHHHQPSIEPHHLVEATTMILKLVAPKSMEFPHNDHHDFGGWSFLQSLSSNSNSNSSQPPKKAMESDFSYVHPSVLKLSQKSLELCTENLGSETGSDTVSECESPIFSHPISPNYALEYSMNVGRESVPRREERNLHRTEYSVPRKEKDKSISHSFPPPLTTMSGSNNLQVRPHRENGRLIIQASEAPPTNACFQAERSDGRLRLSFWADNEEEEREEEFEEEEDIDAGEVETGKDNNDNKYHQRPSSCREDLDEHHHIHRGDKGLCNWEPFWVASS